MTSPFSSADANSGPSCATRLVTPGLSFNLAFGEGHNDLVQLPEPIDLELDLTNRVRYWTDRGDPPRGNTVNRAAIDKKAAPSILITHLMEGIGIALDVPGNRMFITDFAGSVYSADLDGKDERNFLYAQGNLTGIAYAEI